MSVAGELAVRTPIRVDKGIPRDPVPPPRNARYPWATMGVGDSFVFPHRHSLEDTQHQAAGMIAFRHRTTRERYERRTRDEPQDDGSVKTVVRIWRIK